MKANRNKMTVARASTKDTGCHMQRASSKFDKSFKVLRFFECGKMYITVFAIVLAI